MSDLPRVPSAPEPAPAPPGAPAPVPAVAPEVEPLFRRSLRQGRIHPLMPMVQRYRRERAGTGQT
ncbi:MAG: hypothetical protein Q8K96_16975 [Rubrivivax sp.]|nr:hypothetical protein [Rubrivivax sp.]